MRVFEKAILTAVFVTLSGSFNPPPTPVGTPLSADDFRHDLVDLPLCGTPSGGPLAGKAMCTIHFADGSAMLAGSGVVARGFWQFAGDTICRRDQHAPVEAERCVRYERLSDGRYRNSDGVTMCIGPCVAER